MITVLYLTANKIPEKFAQEQRRILKEAIGDLPLISISREPLDFGFNLIDDGKAGYENIYRQMLRGAKIATTPYIIIAEDDVLYPKEHFTTPLPSLDTFMYNQSRWGIYTWGEPLFSWRNRKSNCSLIAPRELMIEALEERFAKYPNGMPPEHIGELGRERVDKWLGVTVRKSVEIFTYVPLIQFSHETGAEERQQRRRKRHGQLRAKEIPVWGKAKNVVKLFQ